MGLARTLAVPESGNEAEDTTAFMLSQSVSSIGFLIEVSPSVPLLLCGVKREELAVFRPRNLFKLCFFIFLNVFVLRCVLYSTETTYPLSMPSGALVREVSESFPIKTDGLRLCFSAGNAQDTVQPLSLI